jgi:glycosyltransferase involved in cell wall biosynthesis
MRILIVSQYYWPETFRINEVAKSICQAGCEVTVLTGQPNYPDGVIADGYSAAALRTQPHDGLTIYRVPLVPRGRGSAMRLALNYLSFVATASVFGPWLLRGRPVDAILVYAPSPILQAIPAIWLAWLKNAPLATWVQDLWPESLRATGFVRNPRLLAAVAAVVSWIYRRNDLLLVQSNAFVEPVVRMAGGTPVVYHPNPGELAFSAPAGDRAPALMLEPGFNVVFAGNLGAVQALDTVLAAAQLLSDVPNVRFVLVGSGSRGDWVQKEVQRRGLNNVQLPGRFAPQEMPGILAQASALLVSLVRDPTMAQTIPSKIQAYLAAARPILAALDGEGARVVNEAAAGIVCAAEDARALADAVLRLRAMSPEERQDMAQRARLYYERHFEPTALAARMVQQLEALARSQRSITLEWRTKWTKYWCSAPRACSATRCFGSSRAARVLRSSVRCDRRRRCTGCRKSSATI